jgi:hypothetical protein
VDSGTIRSEHVLHDAKVLRAAVHFQRVAAQKTRDEGVGVRREVGFESGNNVWKGGGEWMDGGWK